MCPATNNNMAQERWLWLGHKLTSYITCRYSFRMYMYSKIYLYSYMSLAAITGISFHIYSLYFMLHRFTDSEVNMKRSIILAIKRVGHFSSTGISDNIRTRLQDLPNSKTAFSFRQLFFFSNSTTKANWQTDGWKDRQTVSGWLKSSWLFIYAKMVYSTKILPYLTIFYCCRFQNTKKILVNTWAAPRKKGP